MEGNPTPQQTAPPAASSRFENCEECGAPMDPQQRYCINCAARRKGAESPAERYFASVARRTRRTASVPAPRSSAGRAAAVGFFALLPIAVALGVLVGRSGGDSGSSVDEQALLNALNKQGAAASTAAGAGVATTASASRLSSDFGLDKGFTVKIGTLPAASDQAAAAKAKKDAESKGATKVGIIDPSAFTITPSQGGGGYILYSGEFKQRGQAEAALKKLKPKFKSAQVIAVKSASSGPAGGKVVAKTKYGAVHKVTGLKTSDQQKAQGAQIAQQVAGTTGKDYVQQEKNLPDVIPVGPSTGSSAPAPKGGGD
jgi:hypothetical protein